MSIRSSTKRPENRYEIEQSKSTTPERVLDALLRP
jgi:hypothetical protein